MHSILVTGSDGYIGSVLSDALAVEKYRVTGLDTFFFEYDILGEYRPKYRVIRRDVREISPQDLKGIDAIIHLAALSNDPMGALDPKLTAHINHGTTVRLAKLAKDAGVKRFLFSSSCSIYGIADGTVDETSEVNPLTAYAKSKIASEKNLFALSDDSFCVVSLRNSTVYGYSPKFRDDLVVNNLVVSALTTGEIRIMSDGTPWRPLIDVRDLSSIFIRFLTAPATKINGQLFNIGFNENNIQVKTIAEEVKHHLPQCKITYTGEHGTDSRSYKVSFDKLSALLPDLTQQWPISTSIEDMIKRLKAVIASGSFNRKGFVRLAQLKKLQQSKAITADLFWKNSS